MSSKRTTYLADLKDRATPRYLDQAFGRWEFRKDHHVLASLAEAHSAIPKSWERIHATARKLLADETMTPAARLLGAADLADKIATTVETSVEQARTGAKRKLAELRKELEERLTPPSNAGHAAMYVEIRQLWQHLKPEEKIVRANAALDSGDDTTVRALVTAPAYLSGLNDATHARLRNGYLQRVEPEKIALGAEIEKGLALLEGAAGEFIAHVGEELPWTAVEQMRAAKVA